jgi:hypothetical protein
VVSAFAKGRRPTYELRLWVSYAGGEVPVPMSEAIGPASGIPVISSPSSTSTMTVPSGSTLAL